MRPLFEVGFTLAVAGTLLGGCASTPDVKSVYYLPRAVTQFQVTQTFVCPVAKDSNTLSVTAAVTATTSYVADFENGKQTINFGGYSTPFADIDLAMTRSADKRLLGINSSSTGEGSTILQDVVALGTAAAGAFGGAAAAVKEAGPGAHASNVCSVVRAHYTGDPKNAPTAAITYSANIVYGLPANADDANMLAIGIDPESTPTVARGPTSWRQTVTPASDQAGLVLQGALRKALPGSDPFAFTLSLAGTRDIADDADWAGASKRYTPGDGVIMLNRVVNADLELSGPKFLPTGRTDGPLWRGAIMVPTRKTYPLPLPSPALFGKTQFTLTLSDAGAVTKLEYNTTSGAGDATTAATAVAKALQPTSTASKASETQAKADLIYQQYRLSSCQKEPSSCQSK